MCGIAGAVNVPNASEVVKEMLVQMQHRGHEASGIVSWDGAAMHEARGFGRVQQTFHDEFDFASRLPGNAAVGHVWYSTTADAGAAKNVQPLTGKVRGVPTAVAHNGDLENYAALYAQYADSGAVFQTTSDTELFLTIAAHAGRCDFTKAVGDMVAQARGAYSALFLRPDGLYALRDPLGVRPLVMERCGDGWLFASESCAFQSLTQEICAPVTDVADVAAGMLLALPNHSAAAPTPSKVGVRHDASGRERVAHCVFEYVYFAWLTSVIDGLPVSAVRKKLGEASGLLFLEKMRRLGIGTEGMVVCGVPDSAVGIATGVVASTGLVYYPLLTRNPGAERTFIHPGAKRRKRAVAVKLSVVPHWARGKRVVVVDDSVVRGNTMPQIVRMLFDAGATEVHILIASPPWRRRCTLGISTKTDRELFAVAFPTVEEMEAEIGATTLTFLPIEDVLAAVSDPDQLRHCAMCMTGVHPEDGLQPLQ